MEASTRKQYDLDRVEHSTLVAAVIHYAGVVANPIECVRVLTTLCPDSKRPWDELVAEYRQNVLDLENHRHRNDPWQTPDDKLDLALGRIAAPREP